MENLALTIGLVLDRTWRSDLDTTILKDVRGRQLQALLRIMMGIEYTTVVSCMVTELLTATTWLRIDQDIIDTLTTSLVL